MKVRFDAVDSYLPNTDGEVKNTDFANSMMITIVYALVMDVAFG